jgi:hypothetical protein
MRERKNSGAHLVLHFQVDVFAFVFFLFFFVVHRFLFFIFFLCRFVEKKFSPNRPIFSLSSTTNARARRKREHHLKARHPRDGVVCHYQSRGEKDSPRRGANIPNRLERHERANRTKTLEKKLGRTDADELVPGEDSEVGFVV